MNWNIDWQFVECLILAVAAIAAWRQLKKMNERNDLDRLIAWKASVQEVNHLIFGDPATFRKVLYPEAATDDDVRELTATYASLHALEVIYYMRKDDDSETERLQDFLKQYVSGEPFHKMWRNDAFRAAFSEDFRKAIGGFISPSD